jgi:hypothetical protein
MEEMGRKGRLGSQMGSRGIVDGEFVGLRKRKMEWTREWYWKWDGMGWDGIGEALVRTRTQWEGMCCA